jgi:hypothetical protein
MKIHPVGGKIFHANRQMDGHDEANSRFWQSVNIPQNSGYLELTQIPYNLYL